MALVNWCFIRSMIKKIICLLIWSIPSNQSLSTTRSFPDSWRRERRELWHRRRRRGARDQRDGRWEPQEPEVSQEEGGGQQQRRRLLRIRDEMSWTEAHRCFSARNILLWHISKMQHITHYRLNTFPKEVFTISTIVVVAFLYRYILDEAYFLMLQIYLTKNVHVLYTTNKRVPN